MKITEEIMETTTKIPGLDPVGTVEFDNGSKVPLYETREETAESWNKEAKALFLKYYREEYGEDPKNEDAAFDAYSDAVRENLGCNGAFKIAMSAAKKAADGSGTE